jgi:Fe-S cluster biogenesis protein NfuA
MLDILNRTKAKLKETISNQTPTPKTGDTKMDVQIRMQPTPNPQALKFVMNQSVKDIGKATYNSKEETYGNILAFSLMEVPEAIQVHMFENVITVTFAEPTDPYDKVDDVVSVIKTRYPVHDPSFTVEGDKKEARKERSPEIQQIEEILDRTIRPGLQADGGDVEVVSLKEKYLEIRYEGACGTCPSATMGTLQAIEGILQHEYSSELVVLLADDVY